MSDYLYKDSNCKISLSQMDKTRKTKEKTKTQMKRKELISEIYRLNKVTRKLNYYMNRYYPDQKLRKLEHFQVKKIYEWMLSDVK